MWQKAPENIVLPSDQIHIWRASLDVVQDVEKAFWETLSQKERERAERFRFPTHRSQFIVGRGILRQLLGKYLHQSPETIQFSYGDQGKPFLAKANQKSSNLNFNISHSNGFAIFAFAEKMTFGVDLELIDPNIEFEVIAPRFFSKNEASALFSLPVEKQAEAFFNCWTRKEAFIKACGGGLSIPLDQFEMTLLPGDPPKLLAIDWSPEEVADWSVFSFLPEKNMVGALAVKAKSTEVFFFDSIFLK